MVQSAENFPQYKKLEKSHLEQIIQEVASFLVRGIDFKYTKKYLKTYANSFFERSSVIRPFGIWHVNLENCAPKLQISNGSASGSITWIPVIRGNCLLLSLHSDSRITVLTIPYCACAVKIRNINEKNRNKHRDTIGRQLPTNSRRWL